MFGIWWRSERKFLYISKKRFVWAYSGEIVRPPPQDMVEGNNKVPNMPKWVVEANQKTSYMPNNGGGETKKWIYFQNLLGYMVEDIKKSSYMPKQEFVHGGGHKEKPLYAQIDSGDGGGQKKQSLYTQTGCKNK